MDKLKMNELLNLPCGGKVRKVYGGFIYIEETGAVFVPNNKKRKKKATIEYSEELRQAMELIWKAYPSGKRVSKPMVLKSLSAIKLNKKMLSEILADIEKRKQDGSWLDDNGKYIPMLTTYINQRRWEDAVGTFNTKLDKWDT